VAQKESTRQEDERLREELKNASLDKIKKAIRLALSPVKEKKKHSKALPK